MHISLVTYHGSLEHIKGLNLKIQDIVLDFNFVLNVKMLITQKINFLLILKDRHLFEAAN